MVFPDDRTIDTRRTDSLETKAKNFGGSVVDADDCGVGVISASE